MEHGIVRLTGSIANINAALNGLKYTPKVPLQHSGKIR